MLTTHIASAVALLGTTTGLAIMGIRTAGTDDFRQAHAVYDVMSLLTFSLGIPLSFIALASGDRCWPRRRSGGSSATGG